DAPCSRVSVLQHTATSYISPLSLHDALPILRVARIGRVLLRYRLDALLDGSPAERWLRLLRPFVPRASADVQALPRGARLRLALDRKSTRLNSSHVKISYAVFCLKKKKT